MASNPYVNRVEYGGSTLIDLTGDDITAASVLSGKKFHLPSGAPGTGSIPTKTASDLSASGKTVTVPAGYYATQATKDVTTGSASTPATSITANPSISVGSGGLITASVSTSKSVTPSVSAGYVASGTAGTVSVSGSATQQLSTQAAQTITPGTSAKTAVAAGKYTTGAVTVAGSSNLTAGNIKSGVSIFGVTGTYTGTTVYYDLDPVSVTMNANQVLSANGAIASGAGSAYLLSNLFTVSAGTVYRINAKMNYGNYLYAWYNSSGTIIGGEKAASGGSWTILTDKVITAPSGAVQMRYGSYNNISYSVKRRIRA